MCYISEIYKNGILTNRYVYDKLNRMVREDNKETGHTSVFAYDVGGNILSKSVYEFTLGLLAEKTPVSVKSYSYKATGWRDQMTAFNGEKCEYDNMGRPTIYRNKTLTWSKYGTLTSYNGNTYTYDANGVRLTKIANGITTKFFVSGTKILKINLGARDLWFRYGVSGVQGFMLDGQEYIYRKNIQGDVTHIYRLYNGTLELAAEYKYDAWGKCEVVDIDQSTIGELNPIRYRGYYYDTETGLYYLNARYYDPETGRFISADDTQFIAPNTINGLNLYAYCASNPVMNIDPSGRFFLTLLSILGAVAISAAVGGVVSGITEVANNGNFWDGFLGGAISGAISAIGIAVGLATGGIGGLLFAGAIGFVGGAAGSVVQQGISYGWDKIDLGTVLFAGAVSGIGNMASFVFTSAIAKGVDAVIGKTFLQKFVSALKFNPYTSLVGGVVLGFPYSLLSIVPNTLWEKYYKRV